MNKKVTQKKQNHETVYIQWTANICKILIVKLKPKKAEPTQHLQLYMVEMVILVFRFFFNDSLEELRSNTFSNKQLFCKYSINKWNVPFQILEKNNFSDNVVQLTKLCVWKGA